MAQLTQVDKKIGMDRWNIVKFQLLTYCFLNKIHVSQHDLSCLTLLALSGVRTLEEFCTMARTHEIFSSNQSARNALSKAEKKGLILKQGSNKKRISIHPSLQIQSLGNIVLNYKCFHLEPVLEPAQS
jgi:hypothetical protein